MYMAPHPYKVKTKKIKQLTTYRHHNISGLAIESDKRLLKTLTQVSFSSYEGSELVETTQLPQSYSTELITR